MTFDFSADNNLFQNFEEYSVVFRDRMGTVDLCCRKGGPFPTDAEYHISSINIYQKLLIIITITAQLLTNAKRVLLAALFHRAPPGTAYHFSLDKGILHHDRP